MATRTIAYLTPLYFDERSCLGGGERYPLNLARGVVAASGGDYAVELISFGAAPLRRELAPGVGLRVLPMAGRPAHPLDVLSWELPAAIAGADLLHIHQVHTRCSEVGLLVARARRLPVCLTDHGGVSSDLGAELGAWDLVDRVVCQSDFGRSLYRTSAPTVVIKGGVDGGPFTPPPPGGRPPRDRVLYVGRLLPHKGIDRLIEALPPGLPLTVCGRPYHDDYHARLKALAAGKPVTFVTDADDAAIRGLYARAWANVLPSAYRDCYGQVHLAPELMGFTLLEAMACGTPAVCSRVAAMPEFVRHGETGFVFADEAELHEQLKTLASDPALVERMGAAARRAVEEEFDLTVAGARLLAVYRDLLGDAAAGGIEEAAA
jgi:glycosyltransferase involved in cell wall biosynthesis